MDVGARRADAGQASELEELSREECVALLSSHSVGRVAVIDVDGIPVVVPVNYALAGETVVFRTDAGTKFDALKRHPVAFQLDEIDPLHRTGWSVLVQGIAHEVVSEDTGAEVDPWIGPKRHWIQIVPRYINGRRIRLPDGGYEAGGYL